MPKTDLADLSTETLSQQKKSLAQTSIGLAAAMVVACTILFYLILKNKNYALIAVIPACMLSLIPSFLRLGQINAELKLRKKRQNTQPLS
ncbi:hypothetical protein ABDK00_008670 [Niabella insulamsoli]|uniref:hypothetical protein n=1 Tax=Niabella insulamsoli TaxID=3144874 RepID=UPI0031FD5499